MVEGIAICYPPFFSVTLRKDRHAWPVLHDKRDGYVRVSFHGKMRHRARKQGWRQDAGF